MKRFHCPVPGCATIFVGKGKHYEAHIVMPHITCICGWVGVSFKKHVAQRERYGLKGKHELV